MLRIIAASDTHNWNEKLELPAGDILMHAGDLTMSGKMAEVKLVSKWFDELIEKKHYKYIVYVPGNHDFLYEASFDIASSFTNHSQIKCLHNNGCIVEDLLIYGSASTPWFHSWAFNYDRGAPIRKHWDLIPEDLDFLITHGPPMNHCDRVPRGN